MKKLQLQILALVLVIISLASCDFVQDVRDPNAPSAPGNRKVFVEDYTGHKCGNCPEAAVVLKGLEAQYGKKVVPIAIHAGSFAATTPILIYPTDFRTPAGNAYNAQFAFALYPNGLVNRRGHGTSSFIKAYTVWGSEVSQMITQSALFEIKIHNTFNQSNNNLSTDVMVKSLNYNTGVYNLVVLLTEDSIIGEQLDYSITSGSQLDTNYVFNHVLRGAINSTWGDAIFTAATKADLNDSIVKSYPNFNINSGFRAKKCHVIAYVYDADPSSPTYYEVLQVEEADIE